MATESPNANEGPRASIPAEEWYSGNALYNTSVDGFKPPK